MTRFENALHTAATIKDWQEAVELYRGDLLPGCYDDWILPERERLRQDLVNALEQLIACCERAQDYLAARQYAQRLLSSDPLREDTYRRLMKLSALSGDRAGVVRFYNQCVTVLQRELAVEPAAETLAAHQEFLQYLGEPHSASHPSHNGKRLDNLPLQLTRLIGREPDVRQVKALVMTNRLVTLVGAGGVGKTRLALAVAQESRQDFTDGVWFIDLAPLSDETMVLPAVAAALNVRDVPGVALRESIINFLRDKVLLLVLDNCEHLIKPTRSSVELLLPVAPRLRVLATSRQALRIAGEYLCQISPLPVPQSREQDSALALLQYSSVQLFVDRACAAFAPFSLTHENADAVTQICQRLEGIPLALDWLPPA